MTIEATPRNRAGELALEIYRQTLERIRGDRLVQSIVRLDGDVLHIDDFVPNLSSYDRILIAGAGKASVAMAHGLEEVLGDRIDSGLIVTKYGHSEPLKKCRVLEAGHPVPDQNSLLAGAEMLALAGMVGPRDLILFALSGGASALMESPVDGISLEDLQIVNRELLACGATIMTMNAIRSRLSKVKAGGLAKAFGKATLAVLVMSDVEGDRLSVIGSGPFVPPDAQLDMSEILGAFGLEKKLPQHVVEKIKSPTLDAGLTEMPPHRIIGNAHVLGEQAVQAAKEAGLHPSAPWSMSGQAREYPAMLASKNMLPGMSEFPHDCLICIGETVVVKTGDGLGGRAQEMACVFAQVISGREDIAVLVAGSDGTDGPTDAAGALVDGRTLARAEAKGFALDETLANNNSYRFHEAAGTLIKTGPTGSNVNDIAIVVRRTNRDTHHSPH